ncbi:MAG: curli assembly protein CsgF [Pseudomonadota bacterium]
MNNLFVLRRALRLPLLGAMLCLLAGAPARATELVYTPLGAQFGGNPNAAAVMLSQAQATNKHKDVTPDTKQTALQQFNEALSRSILGQLASAATSSIIGANGKLVPGTLQTGNFTITIVDLGNGSLQITTTDKVTGDSTTIVVGQGSVGP